MHLGHSKDRHVNPYEKLFLEWMLLVVLVCSCSTLLSDHQWSAIIPEWRIPWYHLCHLPSMVCNSFTTVHHQSEDLLRDPRAMCEARCKECVSQWAQVFRRQAVHVATGFGINLGAFCNARDLAPIFTEHRERERDSWSFYLFACASNFGAAVKLTTFLCFLKRIGLLDRDMTDMGLSRTAA